MRTLILVALLCSSNLALALDLPKLAVETYQLKNGMTVILAENHALPRVAVELRYLVGSAHEEAGRTGFAHLFEHLMFQGSQNYDQEYFAPFEPLGAQINGTTNKDRTNYYETVPSEYLEMALWMESDRMANLLPALSLDKLNNQRDVVKNERRFRYENRPYGMAWLRLDENIFPKEHPYHHSTIGSHEDLTAASIEDVKTFFERYYVAKNAVLTIAGDFDSKLTKALVEKYFSAIRPGERAENPKTFYPQRSASIHVSETDDVKLPRVYFAWPTPALYKEGDAEMDILASVLSSGKTSRLYQPLVYEQQVAKDVSAFQVSMLHGGMFVVMATAAPGVDAEKLATALGDALKTALKTPANKKEFEKTLNNWKKSFYARLQSNLSVVSQLSNYYHAVGDADYLAKDLERYTKLSPETVHLAASKYLNLETKVQVDIVPVPKPQP